MTKTKPIQMDGFYFLAIDRFEDHKCGSPVDCRRMPARRHPLLCFPKENANRLPYPAPKENHCLLAVVFFYVGGGALDAPAVRLCVFHRTSGEFATLYRGPSKAPAPTFGFSTNCKTPPSRVVFLFYTPYSSFSISSSLSISAFSRSKPAAVVGT